MEEEREEEEEEEEGEEDGEEIEIEEEDNEETSLEIIEYPTTSNPSNNTILQNQKIIVENQQIL